MIFFCTLNSVYAMFDLNNYIYKSCSVRPTKLTILWGKIFWVNWFVFLSHMSIYICLTCNVTSMFQYVKTNQFFKVCRNIASVSIFCPDNSKPVKLSTEYQNYHKYSVLQYCKFCLQHRTPNSGKIEFSL